MPTVRDRTPFDPGPNLIAELARLIGAWRYHRAGRYYRRQFREQKQIRASERERAVMRG